MAFISYVPVNSNNMQIMIYTQQQYFLV